MLTCTGYKISLEEKRAPAFQAVWICTPKAGTSTKHQKIQRKQKFKTFDFQTHLC